MPDSLTLPMLYSIIKQNFPDFEIEFYDETIENIKKEKINADIIGISAITPAFYKAVELSEYFRSKNIPVFIGGSHASLAPDDCIGKFDSVMVGLANETLVDLLNDFKNNNLQKIYRQRPDMSFENFVIPYRDLYMEKFPFCGEVNKIQATYGCSNICKFCVQPHICSGYHQRPVNEVIEEIKSIKSMNIEFVDPNLGKDLDYLKQLCVGLKRLNKKWFAPMTMTVANNEEILRMLKNAGCTGVLIGFESVNPGSISDISKGFNNIEKYKEIISKFHKYKIEITGSFVVGLDGDTKETEKNTFKFIKSSGLDFVRFTINTPYPGTEYYNEMKAAERLETEDYKYYDCCHCVIKPKNLNKKQVEKTFKRLWHKSYSIINIWKRLHYIKSPAARFAMLIKNRIAGKLYIKVSVK